MKLTAKILLFTFLFIMQTLSAEEPILFSDIRGDFFEQKNSFDYSLVHLIDKTDKAWCLNLKDPYTWIKKGFLIDFQKPATINTIYIKNGMVENGNFKKNNRVKTISIFKSETQFSDWKLVQSIELKDIPTFQKIDLYEEVTADSLAFNIDARYKGKNDKLTCISEISFSKPEKELKKKKSNANANVQIYQPIQIEQMKLIPKPDGILTGGGEGFCLCTCKFEKGTWKNISQEQTYLQIIISMVAACGMDGTDLPKGDKLYERIQFIENINKPKNPSSNND
ncbi:hypothetical protein AB3N60_12220 [Leptospira sp. WS39.C2]